MISILIQNFFLSASHKDCDNRNTGMTCLNLKGHKECQCDPGTIWVAPVGMCLNRGGVLCDYWNGRPDNRTCASGECITKCRPSTPQENPDREQHSFHCMDICSVYIGERSESRANLQFQMISWSIILFSPLIQTLYVSVVY